MVSLYHGAIFQLAIVVFCVSIYNLGVFDFSLHPFPRGDQGDCGFQDSIKCLAFLSCRWSEATTIGEYTIVPFTVYTSKYTRLGIPHRFIVVYVCVCLCSPVYDFIFAYHYPLSVTR